MPEVAGPEVTGPEVTAPEVTAPEVTGLRARARHHVMGSGTTVLQTDITGQAGGGDGEGFYADNTRLLRTLVVRADGHRLQPFAASPVGRHALLAYAQVPPAEDVPKERVIVEIAQFLGEGLRTQLRIRNYAAEPARFRLGVELGSDFADAAETHQHRAQDRMSDVRWDRDGRELKFSSERLHAAVSVRVQGGPQPDWDGNELGFDLRVDARAQLVIDLLVEPHLHGRRRPAPPAEFERQAGVAHARRRLEATVPKLVTTNDTVARAWRTAVQDLAALPLGWQAGPATPAAGLPTYQKLFGRDTLATAWQALMAMPAMLHDALRLNAAWQGRAINDWYDEEPGKLIHQAGHGPLAELGKTALRRYYGDYAAPADFLIGLGQYYVWTDDLHTVRELLGPARKAVRWLQDYADLDGDGFIEYVARSQKGVKNQGWKDSPDAIVDERGELVADPIATCELQAYVYSGLRQAAIAFFAAGDRVYAAELVRKAARLRKRFDQAFWMPHERFYALGRGPDDQQIRVVASNPGHLLATGIVPSDKGKDVASRLMQPDLFSGWGIRTLSTGHPSYSPFSYHLGSVWPVDQGTFALGFGRYGCHDELARLAKAFFDMTELFQANRLPESVGGVTRDPQHPHPGIYPKANEPQAWSASAVVIMVQALLGLRPAAPLGLVMVDPHLPAWLPDLRLEGLRVGKATVDLEFWRTKGGHTRWRAAPHGPIRVVRQPPPQAPATTLRRRLRWAFTSMPQRGRI